MDDFERIFARIKNELGIKSMTSLAKEVGRSQPAISEGKRNNKFQEAWAIALATKHGVSAEWLLTGRGAKHSKASNTTTENNEEYPVFIRELIEWAHEMDPHSLDWLENQLETLFPSFRAWREQKKSGAEAPLHQDQVARKVA